MPAAPKRDGASDSGEDGGGDGDHRANPPSLDEKQRRRSKTLSVLEGSLNTLSVGLTTNFISAFAIALYAPEQAPSLIIAMLATVPGLVAAVFQLGVQRFRGLFSSRKHHIVFFAVLQAIMWLPLLFVHTLWQPGVWLIVFVTLNTVFGMLISPVWNSWIGDIVEESERGKFFGLRNMFTGLTTFIATVAAGWMLTVTKPVHPLIGFGILFALAFVFRLMSAYFLSKMDDPPESGLSDDQPDVEGFIRTADKTPLGRFTIFLMLFYVAVYIASPFFAVYQLSILKWDYLTFTIIACTSTVSSFLTMIYWGKYVDDIGSKNVLVVSGFLIPFVPLFWTLTTNVWLLFIIETFSGIAWAGFNLSVSTYLFDATDRKNRTRELAVYTLLIQAAIFIGGMMGTGLVHLIGKANGEAYITVFIVSGVLRLAIVALFYKSLQELRVVQIPVKDRLFKKFIAIHPHQGIVYEPVMENRRAAGMIAYDLPKRIDEEVETYVRDAKGKGRPEKESPIERLEREEDAQDTEAYLKRMKRR